MNMLKNAVRIAIAAGAVAALSACGDSFKGQTFADSMGLTKYHFKSGSKVEIEALGAIVEAEYKLEDKRVRISTGKGETTILRVDDQGCLVLPMMGKACRVKS